MRWLFGCLLAAAALVAVPCRAQELPLPPEHGYWSFGLENDLWGSGKDRHYTHGTKAVYLSPKPPPDLLRRLLGRLPCFACRNMSGVEYVFGQNMFTPEDISREDLIREDRPYAGWLYFGVQLIAPRQLEPDVRQVETMEVNIGMVGPASLAGKTQRLIHKWIASPRPNGWDHQLRNEPGLMLTYTRQWQFFGQTKSSLLERDVSPHIVGAIGNVYTYGGGGLLLRIGKGLRNDGGPETVRPSFPGFAYFAPNGRRSWYAFTGLEVRGMVRNIFLDGNTFTDSHRVAKKPLVLDLQVGLAFTVGRARIAFANVFRSKEFDGQPSSDEYGAITFSFWP